jgi:hypothetical membrane protein
LSYTCLQGFLFYIKENGEVERFMITGKFDSRRTASALLLFGIIQWIIIVIISEGIQPGYISSIHYVSTLGTGETSLMYNTSTVILGVSVFVSSILIHNFYGSRVFFVMFLITGLATMGVGVFPEDSRPMHGIVTPIALIFGAFSAIFSYGLQGKPASYVCVILGLISLISGLVFIPYLGLSVESRDVFMGFYKGTLERIVIYTNLLWVLILGSQLSSTRQVNR